MPLCGPEDIPNPRNAPLHLRLLRDVLGCFSNNLLQLTVLDISPVLSAKVAGEGWLEQLWAAYNAPIRLCLAGRTEQYYGEVVDHRNYILSECIFGYDWKSDRKEWAQNLSHIRVDQLDLEQLIVDTIDKDLRALKVVFLRPWYQGGYSWNKEKGDPYFPEHSESSMPGILSSFTEGRIATAIAAQNLPSLRITAVGEFRFWVEHFTGHTQGYRVWSLRRALDDLSQSEEIFKLLDKEDWSFLAERPEPLIPDYQGKFEEEQEHHGNYMVLSKRAALVH